MARKMLLATAFCVTIATLCALGALGARMLGADAFLDALDAPAAQPPPPPPVPDVFTGMGYVEARSAARGSGRFLIVVAVSPWSGTCTMMDQTTWTDGELVSWIRRRALAVRIDVARDRALARELGITITPTIIVYTREGEVDRVIGYRSGKRLLRWLEATRDRAASG